MNRTILTLSILALLTVAAVPILSADALLSFNPIAFQERLLELVEDTLDSHDVVLSVSVQQESLDLIELHIGMLQSITFATPEFQARADDLLIRATQAFEAGIIFPAVVTEYVNADGKVILTFTQSEGSISFLVHDIRDFDCKAFKPDESDRTITAVDCPQGSP